MIFLAWMIFFQIFNFLLNFFLPPSPTLKGEQDENLVLYLYDYNLAEGLPIALAEISLQELADQFKIVKWVFLIDPKTQEHRGKV